MLSDLIYHIDSKKVISNYKTSIVSKVKKTRGIRTKISNVPALLTELKIELLFVI